MDELDVVIEQLNEQLAQSLRNFEAKVSSMPSIEFLEEFRDRGIATMLFAPTIIKDYFVTTINAEIHRRLAQKE